MVSTTLAAAIALAASSSTVNAFTSSTPIGNNRVAAVVGRPLYTSSADLSEYMAKSHEEKLRAVKDIEDKKNAEIKVRNIMLVLRINCLFVFPEWDLYVYEVILIPMVTSISTLLNTSQELKGEIQQLKSSSGLATTTAAAPAAPLSNIPSSEAEAKLASYQSFMAEYIVNAQNQKLLAVKEAELKAEKKFQEQLEKLFEASGIALPPGAVSGGAAAPVVEVTLFQLRNANIIAAAEKGKSRWGSMEIERAKEEAKSAPVASAAPVPAAAGAAAPSIFDQRNANVVASAGAGKSRWGDMEVAKAANGAAVVTPPAAAPRAAAPATLEDRVNLGAQLLGV